MQIIQLTNCFDTGSAYAKEKSFVKLYDSEADRERRMILHSRPKAPSGPGHLAQNQGPDRRSTRIWLDGCAPPVPTWPVTPGPMRSSIGLTAAIRVKPQPVVLGGDRGKYSYCLMIHLLYWRHM